MRVFSEVGVKLIGDTARAKRNVSLARTFLGIMKSVNAKSNQVQNWTRVLPDGTRIYVSSIHGRDQIIIDAREVSNERGVFGVKYDFEGLSYFVEAPSLSDPEEFSGNRFSDYVNLEGPSWRAESGNPFYELDGDLSEQYSASVEGYVRLSGEEFILLDNGPSTGLFRQTALGLSLEYSLSTLYSTSVPRDLDNVSLVTKPTCIFFDNNSSIRITSHNGINKFSIVAEPSTRYQDSNLNSAAGTIRRGYIVHEFTLEDSGTLTHSVVSVDAPISVVYYTDEPLPEISSPIPNPLGDYQMSNRVLKHVSGNDVTGYIDPAFDGYTAARYGEHSTRVFQQRDGREILDAYYNKEGVLHTIYTDYSGTNIARLKTLIEAIDAPALIPKTSSAGAYSDLYSSAGAAAQAQADALTASTNYNWSVESVTNLYPNPNTNIHQAQSGFVTDLGNLKGILKPGSAGDPESEETYRIVFTKGTTANIAAGCRFYISDIDDNIVQVGLGIGTSSDTFTDGPVAISGAPNPLIVNSSLEEFDPLRISTSIILETDPYLYPAGSNVFPKTTLEISGEGSTLKKALRSSEGFFFDLGDEPVDLTPLVTSFDNELTVYRWVPYWENEDSETGDFIVSTNRTVSNPLETRQKARVRPFSPSGGGIGGVVTLDVREVGKYIGHVSTYADGAFTHSNVSTSPTSSATNFLTVSSRNMALVYRLGVYRRDISPDGVLIFSAGYTSQHNEVPTYIGFNSESYTINNSGAPIEDFTPNSNNYTYVSMSNSNTTDSGGGEYSQTGYSVNRYHCLLELDDGEIGPFPEKFHFIEDSIGYNRYHQFDTFVDDELRAMLACINFNLDYSKAVRIINGVVEVSPPDLPDTFSDVAFFKT